MNTSTINVITKADVRGLANLSLKMNRDKIDSTRVIINTLCKIFICVSYYLFVSNEFILINECERLDVIPKSIRS